MLVVSVKGGQFMPTIAKIAELASFVFDWLAFIIERQADRILIARLSKQSDDPRDAAEHDDRLQPRHGFGAAVLLDRDAGLQ
jgi:hypothetical protein